MVSQSKIRIIRAPLFKGPYSFFALGTESKKGATVRGVVGINELIEEICEEIIDPRFKVEGDIIRIKGDVNEDYGIQFSIRLPDGLKKKVEVRELSERPGTPTEKVELCYNKKVYEKIRKLIEKYEKIPILKPILDIFLPSADRRKYEVEITSNVWENDWTPFYELMCPNEDKKTLEKLIAAGGKEGVTYFSRDDEVEEVIHNNFYKISNDIETLRSIIDNLLGKLMEKERIKFIEPIEPEKPKKLIDIYLRDSPLYTA